MYGIVQVSLDQPGTVIQPERFHTFNGILVGRNHTVAKTKHGNQ